MKNNKTNYFILGLQFTSMLLMPPLVCIFGGMYLQERYNLSDSFMGICVAAAVVLMFVSLYSFARSACNISKKDRNRNVKESGDVEPEK